jgi:hypothetical protein
LREARKELARVKTLLRQQELKREPQQDVKQELRKSK